MSASYRGSCHCRRVTFEALADLRYAIDCNCSICRRRGALWHPAADSELRILTGESDLVLYQFHTNTAKHYFCRACGIAPFVRPRIDPTRWLFNARCVDDIDLSSIRLVPFDGQNWEAAAKAYYERVAKSGRKGRNDKHGGV